MRFVKLFSVVLAGVVTFSAAADFPWFSNGPKRRLETIIVTANYKSPRLIAELIQNESRQTYLLFPAKEGENRVIFCFLQARDMSNISLFAAAKSPVRFVFSIPNGSLFWAMILTFPRRMPLCWAVISL